jgi:hypothetical protein
MLADQRYCYPLTTSDFARRYLLGVDALETTKTPLAVAIFERVFRNLAFPTPFGPTTACHSPLPTPSTS